MGVVELRRVAHHQQAAAGEVHVERAPRRRLGPDGHPPGGPEREQRDGMPLDEDVEVVVVRGHAVPAVPVQVQPDAVERHSRVLDDVLRRLPDGGGRSGLFGLTRRKVEVGGQPGNIHVAVVHPTALRLPLHGAAELGEPRVGDCRRHEVRRVDDTAPLVVGQHAFARIEQRQLGHRTRSIES
jgi:hypothetical protein